MKLLHGVFKRSDVKRGNGRVIKRGGFAHKKHSVFFVGGLQGFADTFGDVKGGGDFLKSDGGFGVYCVHVAVKGLQRLRGGWGRLHVIFDDVANASGCYDVSVSVEGVQEKVGELVFVDVGDKVALDHGALPVGCLLVCEGRETAIRLGQVVMG